MTTALETRREGASRAAWWPALALLATSFLGIAWLSMRADGALAAPVAAVFPPWWPAERAFVAAASAGTVVREGAWANIVVVRSTTGDLPQRLHRAGALLTLNPKALAACLKEST